MLKGRPDQSVAVRYEACSSEPIKLAGACAKLWQIFGLDLLDLQDLETELSRCGV